MWTQTISKIHCLVKLRVNWTQNSAWMHLQIYKRSVFVYVCIIYIYTRKRYKELLYVYDHVINSYLQLRRGQKGCYPEDLNPGTDSFHTGGCSWINIANWFPCPGLNQMNSTVHSNRQTDWDKQEMNCEATLCVASVVYMLCKLFYIRSVFLYETEKLTCKC